MHLSCTHNRRVIALDNGKLINRSDGIVCNKPFKPGSYRNYGMKENVSTAATFRKLR